MIKPEQVPDEVWSQVALRLESAGCIVPDSVAKLVAAEAINAWPNHNTVNDDVVYIINAIILPLPQENPDAEA